MLLVCMYVYVCVLYESLCFGLSVCVYACVYHGMFVCLYVCMYDYTYVFACM